MNFRQLPQNQDLSWFRFQFSYFSSGVLVGLTSCLCFSPTCFLCHLYFISQLVSCVFSECAFFSSPSCQFICIRSLVMCIPGVTVFLCVLCIAPNNPWLPCGFPFCSIFFRPLQSGLFFVRLIDIALLQSISVLNIQIEIQFSCKQLPGNQWT